MASDNMSLNSFGHFLNAVEKAPPAPARRAAVEPTPPEDCAPAECDDPQLKILHALAGRDDTPCAIDLMKDTKLQLTPLLGALQVMQQFGLVKLVQPAAGAEDEPPRVQLTPCGRRTLSASLER